MNNVICFAAAVDDHQCDRRQDSVCILVQSLSCGLSSMAHPHAMDLYVLTSEIGESGYLKSRRLSHYRMLQSHLLLVCFLCLLQNLCNLCTYSMDKVEKPFILFLWKSDCSESAIGCDAAHNFVSSELNLSKNVLMESSGEKD
ncbi:hypothetical protein MUK42_32940 [Musa troglodytarum]|uniref:Uncharacterized protein n=1 Tax=Musa troglodytarum TaxID=320322 RepID=A0A9E7FDQ5_9LILI|nr:hypothetical protein MUK42_32940 [Musa troglodytarum]